MIVNDCFDWNQLFPPCTFVSFMKEENWRILTIDIQDQLVIPGLIDPHIHAIGGGGEQGPYSRTAEGHLSELINDGLTIVVGVLGTDGVSRTLGRRQSF